ncbi:MAG: hypothetical protein QOH72_5561 [Solirubrobacteraceae bacterium]|nr:hypothetical protein [Solirubrobacteraceae bacterium]
MTAIKRRGALVGALAALIPAVVAVPAGAQQPDADHLTNVPNAQPKQPGRPVPNKLSRELAEIPQASGADLIDGGDPGVSPAFYGYDTYIPGTLPLIALPPSTAEAQKTEPDKNTYLVLGGQTGADAAYDYGTHFLYQGHEAGSPGYITRINLDADRDHRVTLMATKDASGADLPDFDGSTWNPFAQVLLFTAESGAPNGGVWQKTLDPGTPAVDLRGIIGSGGYEGIQNDSAGNLRIAEDVGGKNGAATGSFPHSRQPNSFIYRFVPNDKTDLTKGGKLQVLQVESLKTGDPIAFHDGQVEQDISSQDTIDLHSYGNTFKTTWVTIHTAAAGDTTPYDSNALAKAAKGTPFKRPENGVFQPGTRFRSFAFTETGDTDIRTEIGSKGGGFGDVQMLEQRSPTADEGTLHVLFRGDPAHAAFDNIQWLTARTVGVVEDRGDTFHTQGNAPNAPDGALDSGWAIDATVDHSKTDAGVTRFLAEGRDPSATIDSALLDAKTAGFTNDGDNEITGLHVSNGDPTVGGILGAQDPRPFGAGDGEDHRGGHRARGHGGDGRGGLPWRMFWIQQHGDNHTWELVPRP